MAIKTVREIYFSPAGTVKTVVKRLTASLPFEKRSYDLLKDTMGEPEVFSEGDCLIAAVPVYSGRVPEICAERLKRFKGGGVPAIAVVVYGNRDYEDALAELKELLEKRGFKVAAAAAFIGRHSIFPSVGAGRPDGNDMLKIDAFAEICLKAVTEYDTKKETPEIKVKGGFPYRIPGKVPLTPKSRRGCTKCGACAAICPAKAIDPGDFRKTIRERCISCAACIRICPEKVRKFGGILYRIAALNFSRKYKARREPEIFY